MTVSIQRLSWGVWLLLATVLALSAPQNTASAASPVLRLLNVQDHLRMQTSLPPGRHDLPPLMPNAEGIQGFLYAAPRPDGTSLVRIFRMTTDRPAKSSNDEQRQTSVRLKASTNPAFYTLLYEVRSNANLDVPDRSASLHRDCCGYLLELSKAPYAGKSFRATNLLELSQEFPAPYGEFLDIAQECSLPGFQVVPAKSERVPPSLQDLTEVHP